MATGASPSNSSDETLVLALLQSDQRAFAELDRRLSPLIRTVVRRRAPDLVANFEEIDAEVWARLGEYSSTRGSLRSFVASLVMTAIQRVWSQFRPTGLPQRLPRYVDRKGVEDLSLAIESIDSALLPHLADPSLADALDAKIDVELLVARAPVTIRPALRLIYIRELTVAEAAKEVGMTRFALRRKIDRYADTMAAAYAEYAGPMNRTKAA